MIRGKEKRRSKNYKSFVGSNRTNGRREFHRMGSEFLKALEYTEILLEFREITRGVFW